MPADGGAIIEAYRQSRVPLTILPLNQLWEQLAGKSGRTLTEQQQAQLEQYLDLLLDANRMMNLTRIVDREQAATGHVGDALTLLPMIPPQTRRLADIGSGGGVPGLVLAIVLPETSVTLIEATQKKAAFLQTASDKLGLTNVRVLPVRAEDVGHSADRESFDIVTARATGELVFLVEWCMPLLRKGGKLLAMKGQKAAEELLGARKAVHVLAGGEPVVHPVELPGADHHVIVAIPKLGTCLMQYPRRATIAKGKPIA